MEFSKNFRFIFLAYDKVTAVKRLLTEKKPRLIYAFTNNESKRDVDISVVIPVYNQENVIAEVIDRLFRCIKSNFELIIIDDASTDSTCDRIIGSLQRMSFYGNLIKVQVYRNAFSKFETFCDSFGVNNALGKYCLEVQADMLIDDPGFDLRLISALEGNEKIALLSGRGVERLHPIIKHYKTLLGTDRIETRSIIKHILLRLMAQMNIARKPTASNLSSDNVARMGDRALKVYQHPTKIDFEFNGIAGRVGTELNNYLEPDFPKNLIYLGQTVMRGPLFFRLDTFRSLGNFDVDRFFQGFDDHDFCARAMVKGYQVGYCPVNFVSPLHLGTTRKKRSMHTEYLIVRNILRIRKNYLTSQLNDLELNALIGRSKNQIKYF